MAKPPVVIELPDESGHKIGEWYDPSENNARLQRTCCVAVCGHASAHHLCPKHAFPGQVVHVARNGHATPFVIGTWVVERREERLALFLNDFTLGNIFGSRAQAERYLVAEGYSIVEFISRQNAALTMNFRYPGLSRGFWPMDVIASSTALVQGKSD
jgi:hypothetical protein